MNTLKRLGAGMLAFGVAATGLVMGAPVASAHTGRLTTSAVCQTDGTYQVTYNGTTTRVPSYGRGHVADLTIGEILPAGTTVADAPATVTGNTTYTFTQKVPGTAKLAQTTAFLKWGDGARSDPIGQIVLAGDCKPPVRAPSGDLDTFCADGGGRVVASHLSNGTADHVSWRLVSGTVTSHATVVATQHSDDTLAVNGLPDATMVWLQVNTGAGFVDEGSTVTTGRCAPVVVAPTGSFTVVCTATGASVTIGTLSPGSRSRVVWTLTVGSSPQTVSAGDVVAVPARAALALTFKAGYGDSGTVQSERAPAACTPVVPPSGSFTVICSATGANVTIGTLASGTNSHVVWRLTVGSEPQVVSSGDVVAVPALAALALKFTVGGGDSETVHRASAPKACAPIGGRSLDVVKSVSPTGDAAFGDTLTYTLRVTAGGSLGQTDVRVSDYIPGHKPGRDSGATTYVPGSAACDAGTCVAAYDDSAKLVTWGLGDMAPGTSRTVTFQATIDVNTLADGAIPATSVVNSAAVRSTETSSLPSNEVETPVTAVLGVKVGNQPVPHQTPNEATVVPSTALAQTGPAATLPWLLGAGGLFLLMGSALILLARKPEVVRVR